MLFIKNEITEEIVKCFGFTSGGRPRIRKYQAELFYNKCKFQETTITVGEFERDVEFVKRLVKFSNGYLEWVDDENTIVEMQKSFLDFLQRIEIKHDEHQELEHKEEDLQNKGINFIDDKVRFDGQLNYSKFFNIVSDEEERLNDPKIWIYSEQDLEKYTKIDFTNKDSPLFNSLLCVLKVQVLRKIDDISFQTIPRIP